MKSVRLRAGPRCDKLDNARCLLRDLGTHGHALWDRFNAGPEDQLWYYRSLAEAFEARKEVLPADILADLIATVKALEEKAPLHLVSPSHRPTS